MHEYVIHKNVLISRSFYYESCGYVLYINSKQKLDSIKLFIPI